MLLPAELRASLPSSIDADAIRRAVRASGSPGSLGGETWLLDVGGKLAVLVRESIFDPLEPVELSAIARPVALRDRSELEIFPAASSPFVVRPSPLESDTLAALLDEVEGHARVPEQPRESVTLPDLDAIDPILEAEVIAALQAGEYARAAESARELGRQSSPRERDEWHDLVELLALLQAGDPVAAYLWAHGVRCGPATTDDALFGRLIEELERCNEPVLAWAAADRLLFDDSAPQRRARIEAQLDRPSQSLAREVSRRAREFFRGPAEAGDRLAQRGLAHALMEIDELDEALDWIRRAIRAERFDFAARMLETEILERASENHDNRELFAALQEAAEDFHDRPEPLVELADRVRKDDPERALELLRKALERDYDPFILLTLVDVLERTGRREQVIREIELALTDLDAVALVKDELRERLSAARAGLTFVPARAETPAPVAPAINVVMIAVAFVVLAVVVGLLLLM